MEAAGADVFGILHVQIIDVVDLAGSLATASAARGGSGGARRTSPARRTPSGSATTAARARSMTPSARRAVAPAASR